MCLVSAGTLSVASAALVLTFAADSVRGSVAATDARGAAALRRLGAGKGAAALLCNNSQEELARCNWESCTDLRVPMDCQWAEWGDWSECSCAGSRERDRPVARPAAAGGLRCTGQQRVLQPCIPTSQRCAGVVPVDCQLGEWSTWSDCTKTCLRGQQDRIRLIAKQPRNGGLACEGTLAETRECDKGECPGEEAVDCKWAAWTPWSECSASCGGGEAQRTRLVEVAPQHGGRLCQAATSAETARCAAKRCNPEAVDCLWSDWEAWSECSATCGGGQRYRTRSIAREAVPGGVGCSGIFEDFSACNTATCPKIGQDCAFGEWQAWSACSATCLGHHARTRTIDIQAQDGGEPCRGATMELMPCHEDLACQVTDVNCTLGGWESWSSCSQSCSGGTMTRRRNISSAAVGLGTQCEGALQEVSKCGMEACDGKLPEDCLWAEWAEWSVCTVTCGSGQYRRSREIVSEARNGGKVCKEGPSVEMAVCKLKPCIEMVDVCEWSDWGKWTDCERAGTFVNCGGGERKRSRTTALVKEVAGSRAQRQHMVGAFQKNSSSRRLQGLEDMCQEVEDELEPCAQVECHMGEPLDCMWSAWSMWSSCPCAGIQERHRVIASYGTGGGNPCEGAEVEAAPCHSQCGGEDMEQDCAFGSWTHWSACPVSCGGRADAATSKVRYRPILQYPMGGGAPCKGDEKELQPCNLDPCPAAIDCSWGPWSAYSACSTTCGGGQKSRSRTVEQLPEHGGKPCEKAASMMVTGCSTQQCPTDARECEFSPWGDWQVCSAACDGGRQHRGRTVLVEATENGAECAGLRQDFRECNTEPCTEEDPAVPCVWGEWGPWAACSAPCSGHQERNRAVLQFASNGGPPCEGGERAVQACNVGAAACTALMRRDCVFGSWSDWSQCARTCDGGQMSRTRNVRQPAENLGAPCEGAVFQTKSCGTLPACRGNERADCEWDVWEAWSACSRTCGGGQTSRHRSIKREPTAGGRPCDAQPAMETQACNTGACYGTFQVCGWSDWGSWILCPKSCGGAQRERARQKAWVPKPPREEDASGGNSTRSASQRRLVGATLYDTAADLCEGSQKETEPCSPGPCPDAKAPIACQFAAWGEWGPCTCEGLRERQRSVGVKALNGGLGCAGQTRETEECPPPGRCAADHADCELSQWSSWSECTTSCGGGEMYHTRSIILHAQKEGLACNGSLEESTSCGREPCGVPVSCRYGNWGPWSPCSSSCDSGEHTRSRAVAENAAFGGLPCSEAALEERGLCNTQACDASGGSRRDCGWGDWADWTTCSVTCGDGHSLRTRDIATKAANGGRPCEGMYEDFRNCVLGPCDGGPVNCTWADWSAWSTCSDPCAGHQERSRSLSTFAKRGGSCEGAVRELRACKPGDVDRCRSTAGDLDCQFSPWADWPECSRTCDGGQHTTTRSILREARGLGRPCNGSLQIIAACNTQPCPGHEPVDCQLGDWGPFGECPVTCGGGLVQRYRAVKVEAQRGGRLCEPSQTEEAISCNEQSCTPLLHCVWSTWSEWGQCSASCDGGEKRRQRALAAKEAQPAGSFSTLFSSFRAPVALGRVVASLGGWQTSALSLAVVGALAWVVGTGLRPRRLQPGLGYVPLATTETGLLDEEERPGFEMPASSHALPPRFQEFARRMRTGDNGEPTHLICNYVAPAE